jgi:RNA polymerase sigma factor (TIGR02999 family)
MLESDEFDAAGAGAPAEPGMATPVFTRDAGDSRIADRYFSVLYEELHRMAVRELRRHRTAAWSPTTLLHETFLNISLRETALLQDRPRFMAYAARAMRGLMIDSLRRDKTRKRGRDFMIVPLDEPPVEVDEEVAVERLRDALDALGAVDARLAQCVDLKFFCGFTFRDIAELWNVSERTVLRDWDKARVLLHRLLQGCTPPTAQQHP